MENFFMRPIDPDTRLRNDHNTAGMVLSNWGPDDLIECNGEFIAIQDLFRPDGVKYQKVGDRWGLVAKINGHDAVQGVWMAITNMGIPICEIIPEPPPPAPVDFPPEITVTISGQAAQYVRKVS
jgi:hypothetical protein